MANKLIRKFVVWEKYEEDWKLKLIRHRDKSIGYRKTSNHLIKYAKRHFKLKKYNNE